MSDTCVRTMTNEISNERDQPECCDDCPLQDDCGLWRRCGAIEVLYPVGKPSLITKAKNLPVFATRIVTDWLSTQPGNATFEERFHYAMGVEPPEWLHGWDDEYAHKHEYYFKEWIERTKKELGLNE